MTSPDSGVFPDPYKMSTFSLVRPDFNDRKAMRYLATLENKGFNLRVPTLVTPQLFHTVYACMKNLLWDLRIDEKSAGRDEGSLGFDPSDGLKNFVRFTWAESQVTAGLFIPLWAKVFRAWDTLGVRYDNTVDGKIKILEHWYMLWEGYARTYQKFGVRSGAEETVFVKRIVMNKAAVETELEAT